jgi:hypothetical protein
VRWFDTDVSGLHIGFIFKGQTLQGGRGVGCAFSYITAQRISQAFFLDCLALEIGSHLLLWLLCGLRSTLSLNNTREEQNRLKTQLVKLLKDCFFLKLMLSLLQNHVFRSLPVVLEHYNIFSNWNKTTSNLLYKKTWKSQPERVCLYWKRFPPYILIQVKRMGRC